LYLHGRAWFAAANMVGSLSLMKDSAPLARGVAAYPRSRHAYPLAEWRLTLAKSSFIRLVGPGEHGHRHIAMGMAPK